LAIGVVGRGLVGGARDKCCHFCGDGVRSGVAGNDALVREFCLSLLFLSQLRVLLHEPKDAMVEQHLGT
jgi:hypothetical protein